MAKQVLIDLDIVIDTKSAKKLQKQFTGAIWAATQ